MMDANIASPSPGSSPIDITEISDDQPKHENHSSENTVRDPSNLWQESPFAVGPSFVRWSDEEIGSDCTSCSALSVVCCRFGCGRVGNMVILGQNRDSNPPRLWWVVGPYWPVLLFVTVPFLVILTVFTFWVRLLHESIGIQIAWSLCTLGLFGSILGVSCRDPGILHRHAEPPTEEWIWNDQAKTFRPRGAMYDRECAVIVRGYDHTCPWTGTAIGEDNLCAFKLFVGLVFTTIIFDMGLLLVFPYANLGGS